MNKALVVALAALIILPLAFFGCKSKVENPPEMMSVETTGTGVIPGEAMPTQPIEPAQNVAMEPIPPTASPELAAKPPAMPQEKLSRNKDIQLALQKAGFYKGSVDGKIGLKTKKAIVAFQKEKGLKADGKVGPKTWAELEKYLAQQ